MRNPRPQSQKGAKRRAVSSWDREGAAGRTVQKGPPQGGICPADRGSPVQVLDLLSVRGPGDEAGAMGGVAAAGEMSPPPLPSHFQALLKGTRRLRRARQMIRYASSSPYTPKALSPPCRAPWGCAQSPCSPEPPLSCSPRTRSPSRGCVVAICSLTISWRFIASKPWRKTTWISREFAATQWARG